MKEHKWAEFSFLSIGCLEDVFPQVMRSDVKLTQLHLVSSSRMLAENYLSWSEWRSRKVFLDMQFPHLFE